ncbi:MAG: hypothetical protein EZS28_053732 [Streblomastix strix]|uniref:Uncharacterized protein n=1 Tax=Streblomastix strix TaxID=222440 RepID=A0A5J4R2D3_9EUKA|nr:MAG: hypothetical protein EZS28_053732 [Streblomastix strix]
MIPHQRFKYLGWQWNTATMDVQMPAPRRKIMKTLVNNWLEATRNKAEVNIPLTYSLNRRAIISKISNDTCFFSSQQSKPPQNNNDIKWKLGKESYITYIYIIILVLMAGLDKFEQTETSSRFNSFNFIDSRCFRNWFWLNIGGQLIVTDGCKLVGPRLVVQSRESCFIQSQINGLTYPLRPQKRAKIKEKN